MTQIDIGQISSFEQWYPKQGSSQISATQIYPEQGGVDQVSITEVSTTQVSSIQNPLRYNSVAEVGTSEIGFFQPSTAQVSMTEIGTSEVSPVQFSSKQDSATQINPWQFSIFQSGAIHLNPTKISFPSSITLQQLLSSHNSPFEITNISQDNPLNLWQTLFDPTFNINLQITDLPIGQLAEAQITNYDSFGRPNGGTIFIDDDANGIGWFIDPTPADNSEFTTTLTDTAFRATTGDAFGKYDLLTSILHEMGHLAGIIAGNPGFDKYIQTINDTKPGFLTKV